MSQRAGPGLRRLRAPHRRRDRRRRGRWWPISPIPGSTTATTRPVWVSRRTTWPCSTAPGAGTWPSSTTTTGGSPTFLSRLVAVLERRSRDRAWPAARVVLDRGAGDDDRAVAHPALRPGRNDDLLDLVLAEEWFMLLEQRRLAARGLGGTGAAVARPVLRRPPVLPVGRPRRGGPSTSSTPPSWRTRMHRGQSGAWRGPDRGLAVADDVLAFWDGWLQGRPDQVRRPDGTPTRPLAPAPGPGPSPGGTDVRRPRGRRPGRGPRRVGAPRPPPTEAGRGAAELTRPGRRRPQARRDRPGRLGRPPVTLRPAVVA